MAARALTLFATLALSGRAAAAGHEADEVVCVEGFIMDQWCIDWGSLFDRQQFPTLEHPDEHSVHCLVDVNVCLDSNWYILGDPEGGSTRYTTRYILTDESKAMTLATARAEGDPAGSPSNDPAEDIKPCTTCTGGGAVIKGFRATAIGRVKPAPDPAAYPVEGTFEISYVYNNEKGTCADPWPCQVCDGGDGHRSRKVLFSTSLPCC